MAQDPKLSAVDLNALVVLEALLLERHVTRAAARVGLSQSATSHALARLRELYDDPLLVRSGKTLVLTPRAESLLPSLGRGLSELRTTVTKAAPFDPSTARREFTLATADYGFAVLLPPLLSEIEHEAPNIDLAVVNASDTDALLESGEVDLAIVAGKPTVSSFKSKKLFSDGFVCMVRRDHPRVKKTLTLATYLELRHVLVAPSGSPGSIVDTELARRGHTRRVAVRVPSFLAAPLVVSESDFINTGPIRVARRMEKVHPIRLIPPPLPLPAFALHLTWHARSDVDPAHTWLRQTIERVASEI
jgi:DNA-binding transcriptional LysR family regulator